MAPTGVNDYFSMFLFILFVKRHIFCHLQPPCCTTTSTSGPPSIWVTLDSMRILHGCGKFLFRPDTDPGAPRGSWAQTEQQKWGVSSNGQVCFERPRRHEIRSAVQCMWWKTLLVSAGWDCAKLIQVCLVPLGSCLFIFMNMCIYELSLHSLSQHATFPPLSMLHIITTPQLLSKHFSSFWVYLFIVYWWIWLKWSV